MSVKTLTRAALLTAAALIMFIIELQIPNPLPFPGMKLGLANIITVYAIYTLGAGQALAILLCRIILGSIFAGNAMGFFYSLAGGLLCYCAMLSLRRVLTLRQIWALSVIGAIFHNIGQILVAAFVTRSWYILAYLPVLLISGIFSGLFTGLCAQFVCSRGDLMKK